MVRAATKKEIEILEKEGFSKGWHDGLMNQECAPPFPARSIQARKYLDGHKAGKQHRAFLNARGMSHVSRSVEKTEAGWSWTVLVEGRIAAGGCEKTRKLAEGLAESTAIEEAFSATTIT